MEELKVFENAEFGSVRAVEIDGEPWLVGKDVAAALGYKETAKAVREHVDDEDKGVSILDTPGGKQEMAIINESGMYSLILSSKLESAKKFKRWVTSEVIPSIRKHGAYMTRTTIDELLENPDMIIQMATVLKEERAKRKQLEQTAAVQALQIAEMQPKASYYDLVLACKDLIPISVIAKDYGWSAKRMNEWLREQGVQYRQGKIWILYQRFAEQGYTQTKTHTHPGNDGIPHATVNTYWTQKGRLFIYERMKGCGVLPIIERGGSCDSEKVG